MRPPVLLALVAVLVVGLAACGGGGGGISKERLSDLVLRRQDVGIHFVAFYAGRQTQLDNQGTPREDPSRFGRDGGWIARFRRSGAVAGARGPLVVESRADLFSGGGGAGKDLGLYQRQLESGTPDAKPLKLPKLGDGAVGSTFVQPGGRPLRFFVIAWRYRNATASVTVEGFDGRVQSRDAIRLARRQQRRLAAA